MDMLKKGLSEQMPVGQKEPRKTEEKTQRPVQQDKKAAGKFTVRK